MTRPRELPLPKCPVGCRIDGPGKATSRFRIGRCWFWSALFSAFALTNLLAVCVYAVITPTQDAWAAYLPFLLVLIIPTGLTTLAALVALRLRDTGVSAAWSPFAIGLTIVLVLNAKLWWAGAIYATLFAIYAGLTPGTPKPVSDDAAE